MCRSFFLIFLYRSKEWASIPENTVTAPNKDDGEFFVSLDDFLTYFSQTTICSLTPDFDRYGSSDSLSEFTLGFLIRIRQNNF